MEDFARLIKTLDATNKTNAKVDAMAEYFLNAADQDKVWAIALLSHRRPPRPVNTTLLRQWANELANIPLWLFEESYHIVGDLAETIALVIPASEARTENNKPPKKSLAQYMDEMIALKKMADPEKRAYLQENWLMMDFYQRLVFTKLITGSFRIGLSQKLMTRALSKATKVEESLIAHKLMGNWNPAEISFSELILEENRSDRLSAPYPFFLAYALEGEVSALGDPADWQIEHKWDGIRSQTIIREGQLFVWSRGEELVTDKYPEFAVLPQYIPDGTVIDGEILPFKDGKTGSFHQLQTRIGRKTVSASVLKNTPVIIKAYDLLEWNGSDIRQKPLSERRKLLENLIHSIPRNGVPLHLSESVPLNSWREVADERERSRELNSEGLMIKRRDSAYQIGRKKGDWWKWKVDPLSIDAVLTYAMRGHGRRSNLFTDYTFALWSESESGKPELVTFAKAYSGLTNEEFAQVDHWIQRNTMERYGPVRSVVPELVFEIGFEGIALSKRHKSGVATRFPRIIRWRKDKKIEDANTLDDLKAMIT